MWRLAISIILFLLSLLVLVKAPTNFFWRLSVAITEFPYTFIAVQLFVLFFFLKVEKYQIILFLINICTLIQFIIPIGAAFQRGKSLDKDLKAIFPYKQNENQLKKPFALSKLFGGIGIEDVKPEIVTYKKLPERDLNIDFYSAGNKKAPCIIIIHGGSWSEGDSKQLPDLNSYLANRGYHVAAINYRLAPKYKSPAPVEDTKEVMAYLTQHSDKLNIDTTNFVLLGRSAGGQIALVSAYTFHDPRIKGVISFYAPADMVWGGRIKVNKLVLNTEKVFDEYLGGNIDQVPEKFRESSSCEFVDKNSTPTLLIHGKIDAMVAYEHANRLSNKLKEHGVKHYFLNLPCSTHGCDYNINGPSGQLTTFAIERFINSVTSH